jgi:alkylated DNA repair dioxygenase AlkB
VLVPGQRSFFGDGEPSFDGRFASSKRIRLAHGAWIDHLPGWVQGHQALMDALVAGTRWHEERRQMYEREVDVPRLLASLPDDGPGHPLIAEMQRALDARYDTKFERIGLGLYRDGRDSVAWHGDYVARELPEAIVATLSVGEPRRFLLRPASSEPDADGASRSLQTFNLGWGDLLVMGGTCQRTWRHCIPKVARAAPRLVVVFRPVWEPPSPHTYRPRGY